METQTIEQKAPAKKKVKAKKKAQSKAVAIHKPALPVERTFLQVVAEATLDPRCDVEKMRALLDMQRDIEERDAKKAFTRAFNALQAELPIINKDGKIDHGDGTTARGNQRLKTRFATYPNLNRVVGPLLKKHGFTFSTSMEPDPNGSMIAVSTLSHIEGDFRKTHFRLTADTTGSKNNQQGWGSSQQYGMRYNMIALLNIVTEAKDDADNDGFAKPVDDGPISDKQAKELIRLLDDAGGDKAKFCAAFEVDGIAMILAKDFADAKMRIARYKTAKVNKTKATTSDFPGDRK